MRFAKKCSRPEQETVFAVIDMLEGGSSDALDELIAKVPPPPASLVSSCVPTPVDDVQVPVQVPAPAAPVILNPSALFKKILNRKASEPTSPQQSVPRKRIRVKSPPPESSEHEKQEKPPDDAVMSTVFSQDELAIIAEAALAAPIAGGKHTQLQRINAVNKANGKNAKGKGEGKGKGEAKDKNAKGKGKGKSKAKGKKAKGKGKGKGKKEKDEEEDKEEDKEEEEEEDKEEDKEDGEDGELLETHEHTDGDDDEAARKKRHAKLKNAYCSKFSKRAFAVEMKVSEDKTVALKKGREAYKAAADEYDEGVDVN